VDRLNGPDALLPAFLLARRLGVSRQLINSWVKANKLTPACEAADGRPLYRYLDAAVLEAKMRANPRSHRKPQWDDRDRNSGGTSGQPAYAA
jgi:hypothetical protein